MEEEKDQQQQQTRQVRPEMELERSGQTSHSAIPIQEYGDSAPLLNDSNSKSIHEVAEHREPLTHVKNKTFVMKLSGCFGEKKTRLTPTEIRAFYRLRAECNIPFDAENDQHNRMVGSLWFALVNDTMSSEIPNQKWKEFGFQNIDPRTDFRGGGLTGLRMFTHYAENYPDMIRRMADQNDDFLAAVSSINVTYHLMKYFHLADFLIYEKDRKEICSRKALKNFCSFLAKDQDTFYKFHDLLFTDLYELWIDLKKKKAGVTIMDFGYCINELKRKLKRAMKGDYYRNYEKFRAYYSSIVNWKGKLVIC